MYIEIMSASPGLCFILVLLDDLLQAKGGQYIRLITYAFFIIGKRVNENTGSCLSYFEFLRLQQCNKCWKLVKAKFHYASWFEGGSQLVQSWFEAGCRQVRATSFEPVCDQLRTSFEPASVMEFGFKDLKRKVTCHFSLLVFFVYHNAEWSLSGSVFVQCLREFQRCFTVGRYAIHYSSKTVCCMQQLNPIYTVSQKRPTFDLL